MVLHLNMNEWFFFFFYFIGNTGIIWTSRQDTDDMLQRYIFSFGGFSFLASVFKEKEQQQQQQKKKTGVKSCLTLIFTWKWNNIYYVYL